MQQGVGNFDLDFDFSRDINASDGSTVNTGTINGDVDSTSVKGNGNVVGDDNDGNNTGSVHAGQGSNVNAGGIDNDIDDHSHDVNTQAGGDVATNTGSGQNTQVGDIDSSGGGAAGGSAGHGGGGLINVGSDGGHGGGAAGGSGGGVIIAPTQSSHSNNQSAGDDLSNVDASHSHARCLSATRMTARPARSAVTRPSWTTRRGPSMPATTTTPRTTRSTRTSTPTSTTTCSDRQPQPHNATGGDRSSIPASWRVYRRGTMTQPNDPRKVNVILELIDHTRKIAESNERGDLAERLDKARVRISDPQIRVVIAGQLKQGKSQLLNSLLNVPVARVGDDETTVVATVVSYSEQVSARLIVASPDGAEPSVIPIPPAALRNDLRRAPEAGGREVLRVEVTASSPLLKKGLAFIDTPGVGGHGQPHLSATLGLLPDADAMLMISDTSQEFTEPEMRFIRQAQEICPVAAIVATKTDLYPYWREIVAANQAHLQRAGLSLPVIPASALLRSHAIQLNDKELNEESNFPAIIKFLSEKVLSREDDRIRDQVLAEVRSAAEHLTLRVESELSAFNDPERGTD